MISRRKILSRSRDELNVDFTTEDEEDVWYQKEKLFKDHIQEVLNKWDQIDDEIWAKIICMERNRRVAKAYARAPVLTINGSNEGFDGFRIGLCGFDNPMRDPRTDEIKKQVGHDHIQEVLNKWDQIDDEIWAKIICMERNRRVAKAYARAPVLTINGSNEGFDGFRIGLCGFDNPMRDPRTDEIKKQVGHGVKIKMDDAGNIMLKRVSKSNVYVKEISGGDNSSVSSEIIRNNGLLELEKPVKFFEMKKFQQNVARELKRAYPDRRHLEAQCISCVSFVKDSPELLDCSCWVMVINIVALDMLKSKLPPPMSKRQSAPNLMSVFERSRIAMEEDPYSLPGATPRGQQQQQPAKETRPPKLPPRDLPRVSVPRPDYEDHMVEPNSRSSSSSNRKKGYYDDPYYCGLKARVPNFVKRGQEPVGGMGGPAVSGNGHPMFRNHSQAYLSLFKNPDRSIYDSAYGSCSTVTNQGHVGHTGGGGGGGGSSDDDYSKIYGRIRPQPGGPGYHQLPREVYVGEWE